jgi:hypothetical protein
MIDSANCWKLYTEMVCFADVIISEEKIERRSRLKKAFFFLYSFRFELGHWLKVLSKNHTSAMYK